MAIYLSDTEVFGTGIGAGSTVYLSDDEVFGYAEPVDFTAAATEMQATLPPTPPAKEKPRVEPEGRWEIKPEGSWPDDRSEVEKGLAAGVTGMKAMKPAFNIATSAMVIDRVGQRLDAWDKIDRGEWVPRSVGLAYQNADPAGRQALREQLLAEATKQKDFIAESTQLVKRYQAEQQANRGTTTDLTDVESVKGFADWLAFNGAAGAVYLAPLMLAAATGGPVAAGAVGYGLAFGELNKERVDAAVGTTEPSRFRNPDRQQEAAAGRSGVVAARVAETVPESAAFAVPHAALDYLGPVRRTLTPPLEGVTRGDMLRRLPGTAAQDVAEEGIAGAGQSMIGIAAERSAGEQGGQIFTAENLKRVVNEAAAEAAGAPFGTAINTARDIAATAGDTRPLPPAAGPEPTPEPPRQSTDGDVVAAVAAAPSVDDAIRAASVAVEQQPVEPPRAQSVQAVDEIGRILGYQPEPAAAPREPALGQPDAEPLIWTGRRGDGYETEQAAADALPSRLRVAPDLDWKIERRGDRFVLAGYQRAQPMVTSDGWRVTRNDSGTVSIEGDPAAIASSLQQLGITKYSVSPSGVLVGRSQAEAALFAVHGREEFRSTWLAGRSNLEGKHVSGRTEPGVPARRYGEAAPIVPGASSADRGVHHGPPGAELQRVPTGDAESVGHGRELLGHDGRERPAPDQSPLAQTGVAIGLLNTRARDELAGRAQERVPIERLLRDSLDEPSGRPSTARDADRLPLEQGKPVPPVIRSSPVTGLWRTVPVTEAAPDNAPVAAKGGQRAAAPDSEPTAYEPNAAAASAQFAAGTSRSRVRGEEPANTALPHHEKASAIEPTASGPSAVDADAPLNVYGKPRVLRAFFEANGITAVVPRRDGVTIGRSQAAQAREVMAAHAGHIPGVQVSQSTDKPPANPALDAQDVRRTMDRILELERASESPTSGYQSTPLQPPPAAPPPISGAPRRPGRMDAARAAGELQPGTTAGGWVVTRNSSGTVTIKGHPGAIGSTLQRKGVTGYVVSPSGVLVGRSQADTALEALRGVQGSSEPTESPSAQFGAHSASSASGAARTGNQFPVLAPPTFEADVRVEAPAEAGASISVNDFPAVERFDGKVNVGPAGVRKVKVVAPGQPTYRETDVGGLDDRMREDRQAVPFNSLVADRPEVAIGQGTNRGVHIQFRPGSVSGREHAKPMTGDLAGREYATDLLAPRAVQAVTMFPADFKRTRAITRQRLAEDFERQELPDGRLHFTRKGLPALPAPTLEPIPFTRNPTGTLTVEGNEDVARRVLEAAGVTRLVRSKKGLLVGKSDAAAAEAALIKLAPEPASETVPEPSSEAEADDDLPMGRSYVEMTPEEQQPYDQRQGIKPGRREQVAAALARQELQVLENRIAAARWGQKRLDGASLAGEFNVEDVLRTAEADLAAARQKVQDAEQRAAEAKSAQGKIEDLGEKIGGARKDTATSIGSRARRAGEQDDRPTWAKRFEISQIVRAAGQINAPRNEGRWAITDKRSSDRFGQARPVGGWDKTFATKEEAEAYLPLAAVSLKHRPVPTSAGKYEIWREISDRKRVKVVDRVFDSRHEAMEYMAGNATEILETNTTFGEADLPLPPDRARSGPPRRDGDVNGEDFRTTFGFRAVEFGNWNSQEERQALMNDAYDGLMDLADVLGVPPKAIGLNGDLALAFGARGHGLNSARAHYEPDRAVINLTKERGAGSLAHEWFHALDFYFGRQDGKASSVWKVNPDGTRTLKADVADAASHGFGHKSQVRPEVRAAYENLMRVLFKKATQYVEDTVKVDNFTGRARDDLARELESLRKELAAQKDERYYKRNNKPASAEQLAEFDAIAKRMLDGEAQALEIDWRSVETAQKRIASRWTNDSLEQLGAIYKAVRGRSGFDTQNRNGVMDRLGSAMRRYSERLKQLADAQKGTEKTRMVPTEFAMNAKELDQGRGQDYWTTPHEMAARAFQGYVEDRVAERGGASRFLNYAPENAGILTPWGFKRPYPAGEERKAMNAAFDGFVRTLKTEETDTGVRLYAREKRGDEQPMPSGLTMEEARRQIRAMRGASVEQVQALVDEMTSGWKNGPRITVVETAADLPGNNPPDVRGLYSRGRLWIVAGTPAHRTRAGLARTLAHEAVAHHGLRQMLGREGWSQLMANIQLGIRAKNKELLRIQQIVREAYVDDTGSFALNPTQEADEIAARAVEEAIDADGNFRPGFAFLKAVWARVAQFLRDIGIRVPFSNRELQGMLVLSMRGLEAGSRTAGGAQVAVSAAREDGPVHAYDDDFERPRQARTASVIVDRAADDQPNDAQTKVADVARAAEGGSASFWEIPESSKLDTLLFELQDGRVDLKRAQEAITKAGRQIMEPFDARLAETLYAGRVARRTEVFLESEVKPLIQAMAVNKVTMTELGDYLLARHAPERNAQIARINPALPDGGAGSNSEGTLMTTAAAQAYIGAIAASRRAQLDAIARRVDAITSGTRRLLVVEGLEKQATIDAWESAYANYAPLFKDEALQGAPHPIGMGFNVRGTASKRATGSKAEVSNVLAHVLQQREAAITRAEKNRVGLALYGLALAHPNPGFWTVVHPGMSARRIRDELQSIGIDPAAWGNMDPAPTIRSVDPGTGQAVDRPNPLYKSVQGAIVLRVNGEDRVILLNERNDRALRLALDLKNLDGLTRLDIASSVIGQATRWMAAVNTQYNPRFGLKNFVRDLWTGTANLTNTPLRDRRARVISNVPAALVGIGRALRGDPARTAWSDLWDEFQDVGGRTGYRELFRTADERARRIERELLAAEGLTPGKVVHAVLDLLDGFNSMLENGVRLAAYREAKDIGMSEAAAARLARELTTDFNRKGRAGREINPLYAFFNASVQGTERFLRTLRGPGGAGVAVAGLGLGVLQALMLSFAGYEDDDIPWFVKAQAFIIPIGGDKRYIAIPLGLGFHVLPNAGRVITELVLSGGKDMGEKVVNAIGEIAGAFNPLGGGNVFTLDGALRTVAPTVIDPVVELATNKNFVGRPIERSRYPGDNRPGYELARESTRRTATGQAYIGVSQVINNMSGGNDYEAGVMSWTPERYRHLAYAAGGGLLREVERSIDLAVAVAKGEETKARNLPLTSSFVGEVDQEQATSQAYYEAARKIRKVGSSYRAAEKAGDNKAAQTILLKHPELQLLRTLNKLESDIRDLNKEAGETTGNRERLAQIDRERTALMKQFMETLVALEKQRERGTARKSATIAE